jgi:hypothetical protein
VRSFHGTGYPPLYTSFSVPFLNYCIDWDYNKITWRLRTARDTRSDGLPRPSETEAAPTLLVPSMHQQKRNPTNKRIIQVEESCPLTWSGNDSAFGSFCSMDDEANRWVSVGRMIQERNRLQKIARNISVYRSRQKRLIFRLWTRRCQCRSGWKGSTKRRLCERCFSVYRKG